MTRPPASSRRRPKRQRTATTLYTDDNPSTFTTKVKKSEEAQPALPPVKPSYYYVEDDDDGIDGDDAPPPTAEGPVKGPYNRRKSKPEEEVVASRVVSHDGGSSVAAPVAIAIALPSPTPVTVLVPPVKRKRGRPPKNRSLVPAFPLPRSIPPLKLKPKLKPPVQQKAKKKTKTTPKTTTMTTTSTTTTSSSSTPKMVAKTAPLHSWTPPLHDAMGTFLSHAITVAPILPPVDTSSNQELEQRFPSVFGKGLGVRKNLDPPQWTDLLQPPVYFEDDYSTSGRLDPNLTPVTRSITCVTTRKPDHAYMAVGDTMGFCLVYCMQTMRAVARLETVACQQKARDEQEKIRDQQRRKKRSLVMDTSQTTIVALAMISTRVVIATACELECMDVPSQTSLWVCPLSSDRRVTSLDMHLSTYDVLVSCSLFPETASATPTSPLMLLQHKGSNVEVCDANAPILLKSPCCTAIWDLCVENRLLFVALSGDDQELELVLVQGGSIDNWKVACKTRIPVKSSNHATRLQQSPKGQYTLVASSRGIRLYQTETLQLIHVYGDQLALHGKSVVWQDCLLLGGGEMRNRNSSRRRKHHTNDMFQRGKNLECDDWVKTMCDTTTATSKDEDDKDDDENQKEELGQYVVGVPHFKGPKELCETLHVWKVEHASVVPTLSIPLPPKSDGVQGLVGAGDRMVLATRNGQGHALLPKLESNFAGIMYPPGYLVLSDNLEYLEDEDELDQVLLNDNDLGGTPMMTATTTMAAPVEHEDEDVDVLQMDDDMDEDLKEAMRQSLLEQKLQRERVAMKDVDVDVVNPIVDNNDDTNYLIPCRPEAYLRQAVNSAEDDDDDEEEDVVILTTTTTTTTDNANNDETTQDASTPQDATTPKSLGPFFVSNILQTLGHALPKQTKEDDGAFKIAVTAKVVIASTAPGTSNRPSGRNKRGRASNLEAMLKASINPVLQRYMISNQSAAVDGAGSFYTMPLVQPNPANANTAAVTPSPATSEQDPPPTVVFRSSLTMTSNLRTTNETETTPQEPSVNNNGSKEEVAKESTTTTPGNYGMHNIEAAETKAFEVEFVETLPHATATEGPTVARSLGSLGSSLRPDEAAVALGLLGLSPCHRVLTSTPDLPTSSDADIESHIMSAEPKLLAAASEDSYLSASLLSRANLTTPSNGDFGSDSGSRSSSQPLNHVVYGGDSNPASSDRGSVIADDVEASAIFEIPTKPEMNRNCPACRGRLVVHSCGKRALPIDYDEVAKAERERKQNLEEEKKKMRAEKRRVADQRRREARKQKQRELEERRRREEEELRLEKERLQRLEEQDSSYQRVAVGIDEEQQRRELIVASYANHLSSPEEWPAAVAAATVENHPLEINAVDYNRQAAPALASAPAATYEQAPVPAATYEQAPAPAATYEQAPPPAYEQAPPPVQWERAGTATYSTTSTDYVSSSHDYSAAYQSAAPPRAELKKRSASMATLSSADVLMALAGMAGTKAAEPELPANGLHHLEVSAAYSYEAPSAAHYGAVPATHGFGTGIPTSGASADSKRGIPSYASIHGQHHANGREQHSAGAAAHAFVSYEHVKPPPSAAIDATGSHQTAAYAWPPQRAETDGQHPYAKHSPSVSESYYTGEERRNWPPSQG